jgi:short-subunit dehydrogenase
VQPARDVARQAVAALASGQRMIIPNFGGRLLAFLVRFFPTRLITYFVEKGARPKQAAA